jgi:hypothetical protein
VRGLEFLSQQPRSRLEGAELSPALEPVVDESLRHDREKAADDAEQ